MNCERRAALEQTLQRIRNLLNASMPDEWSTLVEDIKTVVDEHATREHPPRQVSGSRSLETPDAALYCGPPSFCDCARYAAEREKTP